MRRLLLALFASLLAVGGAASAQTVTTEDAFPGVTFSAPIALVAAPGEAARAYVVEQGGAVKAATLGGSAATVFLDLTDRVSYRRGTETGLLGLAFHPGYAQNGRLFVNYTAPGDARGVVVTRISEFRRRDDGAADPDSERVLLEVGQPFDNHNAGTLAFGPDGLLYAALGDGGSGGDPQGNGQNPETLLGALLRLDVDDVPEGAEYGVPQDNPFVGRAGRDEIYATGLRNPWKFSIADDGTIWLGDVGQDVWEEIDRIERGGNYGWGEVEGPACFPAGSSCDLGAYDAPVFSYRHGPSTGVSVTGGVDLRGTPLAGTGDYIYGDFASGRLWALDVSAEPATTTLLLDSDALVSSIDRGPDGAVYVTDYRGTVSRLVAQGGTATAPPAPAGVALRLAGPNPFGAATTVEAEAPAGAPLRVAVFDALGREVARLWDGPAPPDALRLHLDGAGLAAGVYDVRLASGAGRASVRVVHAR